MKYYLFMHKETKKYQIRAQQMKTIVCTGWYDSLSVATLLIQSKDFKYGSVYQNNNTKFKKIKKTATLIGEYYSTDEISRAFPEEFI